MRGFWNCVVVVRLLFCLRSVAEAIDGAARKVSDLTTLSTGNEGGNCLTSTGVLVTVWTTVVVKVLVMMVVAYELIGAAGGQY